MGPLHVGQLILNMALLLVPACLVSYSMFPPDPSEVHFDSKNLIPLVYDYNVSV